MDARAARDTGDSVTRMICLHGPESTGKTTLAPLLARHFGAPLIPEYGRFYAEAHGTDFSMEDLVTIAERHDALTREALAGDPARLILDTDPLMTAVWADMLFGRRDPWFDAWDGVADLYVLLDIDLPWRDDGTRLFGGPVDRRCFFDLSKAELERRGVRWTQVGGKGEARLDNVLEAIAAAGR